uniref:Uncharacterized protein n=1 Tax=Setaria italica TaxID=4555 RepID=K3Z1A6_SETIT
MPRAPSAGARSRRSKLVGSSRRQQMHRMMRRRCDPTQRRRPCHVAATIVDFASILQSKFFLRKQKFVHKWCVNPSKALFT